MARTRAGQGGELQQSEARREFMLSRVQLLVTLWTAARQASQSMGFPRQEYGSMLPFPSPGDLPDRAVGSVSPVLASLPLSHLGGPSCSLEECNSNSVKRRKSVSRCPASATQRERFGDKESGHQPDLKSILSSSCILKTSRK